MSTNPGALGRCVPPDFEHVEKYPLTAETAPARPSPVILGVNWYAEFDRPEKDSHGHYWVARDGQLSSVRGGHCFCLLPRGVEDASGWWDFYDQGQEGACVGFGSSRAMSLLNRKRYFARWLWDRAKATDEWPETNPGDDGGTSVRAGLGILKTEGHVVWESRYRVIDDAPADYVSRDKLGGDPAEGISAYRWVTSMDDLQAVLGHDGADYVTFANSWGRSYPRHTRIPLSVVERLWREDGELGVVTDR
jgi:hypothetical protein